MRKGLEKKLDSIYRDQLDPWDYWKSKYESNKYREQISLVAHSGTPKRILEIACSTGAHTKLIHEAFPEARVVAIDISPSAIARARMNVESSSVDFVAADIFSFVETLEPRSIDAIFWSEAFDFLHEYCTIAEFSNLARRLSVCLAPDGVLCVSHIEPSALSYPVIEAGQKNLRVFHELLRDYFRQSISASRTLRKAETDRAYHHEVRLYRPRLIEFPRIRHAETSIDKIDVIIPARDEVGTVADVVTNMLKAHQVAKVIVVDNGSADGTAEEAAAAGAHIVRCPERGYGRAVKKGLQECENRWVLKLDADIENSESSWVEKLIDYAIREKSELVKTCWPASIEDPERVTNFTVKPALRIFFPELLFLRSPISGIYLFDRQAFDFDQLPNGFPFDIAMLISALNGAMKISQVEIESIRHATIANGKRTYQYYFNMSDELLGYIVEAGFERLQ